MRNDLLILGSLGFYRITAKTKRGVRWIENKVVFQPWQGSPRTGIVCDDGGQVFEIARAALRSHLKVGRPR